MLRAGERLCTAVTYESRFSHAVEALDESEIGERLDDTTRFWQKWSALCTYDGEYREDVLRSALTLKALTYAPSGALLAAATTSLPEVTGGSRNWDYRFTWIRDAAFALYALSILGYRAEAQAFKDWLEWSTVGRPRDLQIMYGLGGERRLTEVELPELDGYRGSRPVRVGNGAYSQFQLDIYGEVLDSAHLYRKFGGEMDPAYWRYLRRVVDFVIDHWREPDEGIWETRGRRQHFVFSKVMCWVALDRAIKAARALALPSDIERWLRVRAEIRDDVLARGYDAERGAFMQAYGSKHLDASALMLPLVGFIRADDPRMRSTIETVERELSSPAGFVYRYRGYDDGLGQDEGAFIICTFWLADNLIALGEIERARALVEKLRGCSNDLGLFSEQIDPKTGEMLGNFPQAFSHVALINAAIQLQKATTADEGRHATED
jgi:GH15 family glucan-1,4-alpha-glucosidase